ncbi:MULTISPECIES: hypothetical protein [unclassified Thermoactinomyces]|jgi:hypothetical protein|uniref:hypothetical protein n=1 Tax=Thermoactinomyces TaxID=2023 RepID=UPI000A3F1103|nr:MULTISPECIES: hypothetical protein [unclassified Thermoactinomyces]MBH8583717.1 hypothetical protein [Thermoactinomyces sp. CICC 10735]
MHNPWLIWAARIIEETLPLVQEQLSHNQSVIWKMENMFEELTFKTSSSKNHHS